MVTLDSQESSDTIYNYRYDSVYVNDSLNIEVDTLYDALKGQKMMLEEIIKNKR